MMNQLEFDPMSGGPQITGTWFNKKTGKTINVRDAFIGDSGMQIMTSTGELIDMNDFSDNYIQCDNNVYDESGKPTGKKEEIDYEALFAETTNNLPKSSIVNTENKIPLENNTVNTITDKTSNLNTEIIKKMFSNFNSYPKLLTDIDWPDTPTIELHNIMHLLDISLDDLSEYIFNNFCTIPEIKQSIKEGLARRLNIEL